VLDIRQVVAFDVRKAFDELDWTLLLGAVRKHVKERWTVLYMEWCESALCQSGRDAGSAQRRDVARLSNFPVLMSQLMHYRVDRWMQEKLPYCPFASYADERRGALYLAGAGAAEA
jgi:RNA-directed DNA polymerase